MSTPYVTFPGTDLAFTENVQLLDSDTAHMYQSSGLWVATYTGYDEAAAFSGKGLSYLMNASNNVATSVGFFALTAATQYTVSVFITPQDAGDRTYLQIDYFDAAFAANGSATPLDDNASTPAGRQVKEATFTPPANTVWGKLRIYYRAGVGGGITGKTLKWDSTCLRTGAIGTFVPSLRIVGDLDVRASVAADDWTPAAAEILLDQYVAGTGGYRLGIETSGAISLVAHGATGAISESSSLFALTAGEATEIRVTMDASAGDLTWYQDNVEVDDDTYTAQALKPAGLDLYVGALSSDASHFNGDIYWLEVRDGIAGPVVARFDAADIAAVLP